METAQHLTTPAETYPTGHIVWHDQLIFPMTTSVKAWCFRSVLCRPAWDPASLPAGLPRTRQGWGTDDYPSETMSAPKSESSIPPERHAAMRVVRDAVARRVGDRPGFDCLLGFLTFEQLAKADPGFCWSIFLDLGEHLRRFAGRYTSADSKRPVTLFLLRRGIESPDRDAIGLASRILERIEVSRPGGRSSRWPLTLLEANQDGVAVAIAVHDGFWTGD